MSNDRKALGRVQLQSRAVAPEAAPARDPVPVVRPLMPPPRPGALSVTDLPAMPGPAPLDLSRLRVDLSALRSVPRVVAMAHKLLPIAESPTELEIVMGNPDNPKAIDELEFVTGKTVRVQVAPQAEVVTHIRGAYDALERGESVYTAAPPPAAPASAGDPARPAPRARSVTPTPSGRSRSRPPGRRQSSAANQAAVRARRDDAAPPSAPRAPAAPPVRKRTPPPRRPLRDSRSDDE